MARKARRPTLPGGLRATSVTAGSVLLAWRSVPHAARYVILRDGRRVHETRKTRFNDTGARPGVTHRYEVRALDRRGRRLGKASKLDVHMPALKRPVAPSLNPPRPPAPGAIAPVAAAPAAPPPVGPGGTGGAPDLPPVTPDPPPPTPIADPLSRAMVDRLFWRAGF